MTTKGGEILQALLEMNSQTMMDMVHYLEICDPTSIHNLLSKTTIVRSLASLALQDKKFPLKK